MMFDDDALRCDDFLGGALQIWQPITGYRAGIDPVLLAASVPARAGQSVLDLGCGAGTAALCLGVRVPGLSLSGLEKHPGYAALAQRNGAWLGLDVETGDVAEMPAALRQQSFDHVIANPPYYDRRTGTAAPDRHREVALGETTPLLVWVRAATKRLKPKGYVHLILKADRLADALAAVSAPLGSVEITPLAPREGRRAELVIVRARKDGRAPLRLNAPIMLHAGASHQRDGEDYTPRIRDVLRRGTAL